MLDRAPARRRHRDQRDPQHVGAPRSAPPRPASGHRDPTPSSSCISRTSAASGDSPGSTLPPGNSQRPAASAGAVRRHGQHATVPDDRGADDDLTLHHHARRLAVDGDAASSRRAFTSARTDENVDEIDALAERLGGRAGLDGAARRPRPAGAPHARARAGPCTGRSRWDRRGPARPALVAAGHLHLRRRLRHRGHRRAGRCWRSAGTPRTCAGGRQGQPDLRSSTSARAATGTCCSCVPTSATDGTLRLEPLRVHAGGIVWCGPYLHIAATATRAVHLPRRRHHAGARRAARPRPRPARARRGKVSTYGYRYVLPVRFAYRAHADDGLEQAALLVPVAGPRGLATRAGRRRVRPRRRRPPGWPASRSTPRRCTWPGRGRRSPGRCCSSDGGVGRHAGRRGRRRPLVRHPLARPVGPGSVYVGTPGGFRRYRWAIPMGPEDIGFWPSTDRSGRSSTRAGAGSTR